MHSQSLLAAKLSIALVTAVLLLSLVNFQVDLQGIFVATTRRIYFYCVSDCFIYFYFTLFGKLTASTKMFLKNKKLRAIYKISTDKNTYFPYILPPPFSFLYRTSCCPRLHPRFRRFVVHAMCQRWRCT